MRRLAALTLALAAILTGCGGDDSSGELRKTQVIERGDDLCRRYGDRAEAITGRLRSSSDPREVAGALRQLGAQAARVGHEFDRLANRAPEPDRPQLRGYIKTSREQIVLLRRAADLFEARNIAKGRAVIRSGQQTAARQRRIAQRFGFKVCGSGAS